MMKRAIAVGVSTLAGLAAVLLANPKGTPSVATADLAGGQGSDSTSGGKTNNSTSNNGTSNNSSAGSSGSSGTDGTYKGTAIQVRNFGTMQVQVTVADGRISGITALQLPDWDRKSQMISSYAVPQLVSSALDSQSADVSYVSGATFTSKAFKQSLQAALAEAGLA
jgi:uncharacterized protein with FMN-binding domain